MAIVGKLTKLKSAIKRWPSFTKPVSAPRTPSSSPPSPSPSPPNAVAAAAIHGDQCAVYVGKSRRRYLVSSEVASHPLFRELVVDEEEETGGGGYVVACEVVLFEHMLWMIENKEADGGQLGSMDELVDFYTC